MSHTVVLNSSYQVLGSIPETDAISHIVEGLAWAAENHPTRVYRAQKISIPAPKVIVLNYHVKVKGFRIKPEQITNLNLFKRDNYTCQYCGRHKSKLKIDERLEMEHIIPISKSGHTTWENITTACSRCNHKKDNRTPHEANMRLLSQPRVPVTWTIRGKSKLTADQIKYVETLLKVKKLDQAIRVALQ